jgi:polar amino acid transport system substrate-binding protein
MAFARIGFAMAQNLLRLAVPLFLCLSTFLPPAAAQTPVIPSFWDSREQLAKPDLSSRQRVRFLTTVDYPPFSYIDQNGRLGGFNVDLARAICQVLEISERCQIQGLPFGELETALASDGGEAIIAGIAVNAASREKLTFTRPYLQFPARFITLSSTSWQEPLYRAVAGQRIGVVKGSAHERMLREQFPEARPVTYDRLEWLYDDLRQGKIAGIFGDGMWLSFWLSGSNSAGCCKFAGGAYLDPGYFGYGLAIATGKEDAQLAEAFNYALKEINANGRFAELYLRYFPTGFY